MKEYMNVFNIISIIDSVPENLESFKKRETPGRLRRHYCGFQLRLLNWVVYVNEILLLNRLKQVTLELLCCRLFTVSSDF